MGLLYRQNLLLSPMLGVTHVPYLLRYVLLLQKPSWPRCLPQEVGADELMEKRNWMCPPKVPPFPQTRINFLIPKSIQPSLANFHKFLVLKGICLQHICIYRFDTYKIILSIAKAKTPVPVSLHSNHS